MKETKDTGDKSKNKKSVSTQKKSTIQKSKNCGMNVEASVIFFNGFHYEHLWQMLKLALTNDEE